MVESLAFFSLLRPLFGVEKPIELASEMERIDQFAFGLTRVNRNAFNFNIGVSGIEVFIFDDIRISAIKGISIGSAKALGIEVLRSASDFFIGRE